MSNSATAEFDWTGRELARLAVRHRTGVARPVARLDAHIDHRDLAVLGRRHRLRERGCELFVLRDRPEAARALGTRHAGEIDLRVEHLLADPFVVDRPVAQDRHPLLVYLVIVERAIVGHHDEKGNAVVHRSPERGDGHQEVAVAADPDREPARAFEGKRGTPRDAWPAADATAAVGA